MRVERLPDIFWGCISFQAILLAGRRNAVYLLRHDNTDTRYIPAHNPFEIINRKHQGKDEIVVFIFPPRDRSIVISR